MTNEDFQHKSINSSRKASQYSSAIQLKGMSGSGAQDPNFYNEDLDEDGVFSKTKSPQSKAQKQFVEAFGFVEAIATKDSKDDMIEQNLKKMFREFMKVQAKLVNDAYIVEERRQSHNSARKGDQEPEEEDDGMTFQALIDLLSQEQLE